MLLEILCDVSTITVMIWDPMLSAGIGKLFLKSKVTATVYQNVLENFLFASAEDLYGDTDFIFQQELAPANSKIF